MQTDQITDDEVGKDVVDGDDNVIGTVSAVETDTAYVDPEPGVLTRAIAAFDLDGIDDEDGYPLRERAVEAVTEDQVRLDADV